MQIKRILILLLAIVSLSDLFAQKDYNIWYFGANAGITFNTDPPSALTDGMVSTFESTSGICDKDGSLLFYTNGDTIWNKRHQPMTNRFLSQVPFYWHRSSFQGSIVVAKPGSDSLYYIFTTNGLEIGLDSLRYSVVNIKGDDGNGEVILWKKALLPHPGEGVVLTRHANNKDIWIGTVDKITGYFNCMRTIDGELSNNIVSSFADSSPNVSYGKFSPDGKTLFLNLGYFKSTGDYFSFFRFNNATGELSARLKIPVRSTSLIGEFSYDSRYFYFQDVGTFNKDILQYDLISWDENKVKQSETRVNTTSSTSKIVGFQLGPDKKIYVFREVEDYLTVIEYPDRKGTACGVKDRRIGLKGRQVSYGGPYYPTYTFRLPYVELGPDTSLCNGDSLILRIGKAGVKSILWSTGDTLPVITVRQTGLYYVTVTNGTGSVTDSIHVYFRKKFPVFIGNDTAFCGAFTHVLHAGVKTKSYQWSTGDTTVSIVVDQPGIYFVAIRDSNSCAAGDTMLIDRLLMPSIAIKHDPIDCKYIFLDASPRQDRTSYLWSTGDTSVRTEVRQTGIYDLVIRNLFCSMNASVEVTDLGPGCDLRYYIPNAFTPGNDGINDLFKVTGTNIRHINMQIYNRWGTKIYEGTEWDGTFEGKPCQQDTYIYFITIMGNGSSQYARQVSGNVTLLR